MILILTTECLKWSSFFENDHHSRNSCFIWSFSVTPFKSVTEHCTSDKCLYYVALRCVTIYMCDNLETMQNITIIQTQTNP